MSTSCRTNVVTVHAQITSSQFAFSSVRVQTTFAYDASSTVLVFLAGGCQEPGQDRAAGRCSPRPHGGGESPAAGQQLSRGHGRRWRCSIALHCLWVRMHAVFPPAYVFRFWQNTGTAFLHVGWFLCLTDPFSLKSFFINSDWHVRTKLFVYISSLWFSNQAEIAQLLLRKGANVNLLNNSMCTALHIAVNKGFTDVVRVLTEHSADVNIQVRTCLLLHFDHLHIMTVQSPAYFHSVYLCSSFL